MHTHWNGENMQTMHKLGLVAILAGAMALGGCDDDGESTETGMGTSVTVGSTDTDPTTAGTATTGEDTTESEGEGDSSTGGGSDVDCSTPLSHAADIQPIWDANCTAACHEAGGSWSTLPLTADVAYDGIFEEDGLQSQLLDGIQLVVPNEPENSYMLLKMLGTQPGSGPGNSQMPLGAPPLDDATIATVEEWIACGAQP
ncbi:MAG: hypothetical protein AAGA54_31075 [Myxococcota bacterium]